MSGVLGHAFDLVDGVDEAPSAAEAGRAFFAKLKRLGIDAIFARAHSPINDDPREHTYYRETPRGWDEMYSQRGFARTNFVTRAARRLTTPFEWSSVTTGGDGPTAQQDRQMWAVMRDFNLSDGLAVPGHGPDYLGVISLGWSRFDHGFDTRRAIVLASHYVHERMRDLAPPDFAPLAALTARERDCIAFVAEGKSDWDISQILGIAESTVHGHIEKAKRRLGVKSRMQAVAKLARAGEL
jgi:DNA-binding CsgD family transcriptional regulator